MTERRKICIVTGSRAEYGLLRGTMQRLRDDARVTLQVVATGMHLSTELGLTYELIEKDGFTIDARVDMLLASDEPRAIAKSMGLGTIGFADAWECLRPDLIVVLGDRFEILSAVQAALVMRLPVAHIHGGEISAGAVDDAIRHSLTKMAHLHFVAADEYRSRVIQLGEDPSRVFHVGSPGLDAIANETPLARDEVERRVGIALGDRSLLVTYHPATLGDQDPLASVNALLEALHELLEDERVSVVMTKPNADAGGRRIAKRLEAWASEHDARRVVLHTNLGSALYLSTLRLVSAVVGNSSSGLIEAPAVGVPTVNVGPRQDGRLRAASVIDCAEDAQAIKQAIGRALSAEHREVTRTMTPPYGRGGDVSRSIAEILVTAPLEGITKKRFHDLRQT